MKLSKTHVRFRAILNLDIVCLIFDFFRVLGGSLQMPLPWRFEHASQSGLQSVLYWRGTSDQRKYPVRSPASVCQRCGHGLCACFQVTIISNKVLRKLKKVCHLNAIP